MILSRLIVHLKQNSAQVMADLFGINIIEIAQHDNAGVIIWIASDRGREPLILPASGSRPGLG
jgi:hypothetical protein